MQNKQAGIMPELKALLWDVDGTLADTERNGHRIAFNFAFEEAGYACRWDESLYGDLLAVTGGKERLGHFFATQNKSVSSAEIADLHRMKTKHYEQIIASGRMPLRPGVLRLLTEAWDANITLAIVTTTTPSALEALIRYSLGEIWFDRFALLAAGDIVASKKPAPDIYQYTLRSLNLLPKICVAIEDSANGLKAAQAADIPCVITVNEYTQNQDFSGAAWVVSDLGEPDAAPIHILSAGSLYDAPHHIVLDDFIRVEK